MHNGNPFTTEGRKNSYCGQNLFRRPVKREGRVYEMMFQERTRVAQGGNKEITELRSPPREEKTQAGGQANPSTYLYFLTIYKFGEQKKHLTSIWNAKLRDSQVALEVKNLPANAGDSGDTGSIPGWGRSPGGGRGNSLQYSCLENPMDRGAWRAAVHGVTQGWTRLSTHMPDWWMSSNRRSGSKGLRKGTGPYDLKQLMATKYRWLSRALTDHLPSPSCFWEPPCSRNTRHSGVFLVRAHSTSPTTGWSRLTPHTELNPLNPSLLSSRIQKSRRSLRCNDNRTLHNQVSSDPYNILREWGRFSHPQFADEVTEAEKAVTGLKLWHGADSGAWSPTFQYSSWRTQKALAATWRLEIPSVGRSTQLLAAAAVLASCLPGQGYKVPTRSTSLHPWRNAIANNGIWGIQVKFNITVLNLARSNVILYLQATESQTSLQHVQTRRLLLTLCVYTKNYILKRTLFLIFFKTENLDLCPQLRCLKSSRKMKRDPDCIH